MGKSTGPGARAASMMAAIVIALVIMGCSKHATVPGGAVTTGSRTDASTAHAKGDGGAKDAGRADGGRATRSDAGGSRDGGAKARTSDAGALVHDAGKSQGCGGLICPAPTTCDASGPAPLCVCPAGYVFVDLGGQNPPCLPNDACHDCDGG